MTSTTEQAPWQFGQAITFLWAGLVFAGLSLFLNFRLAKHEPTPAMVGAFLLIFIAWSLLTIKIANRRNWARIAYLILTIIGLPLNFLVLLAEFSNNPVLGLVSAAAVVLPILGLWLIFTSPAKSLFHGQRSN